MVLLMIVDCEVPVTLGMIPSDKKPASADASENMPMTISEHAFSVQKFYVSPFFYAKHVGGLMRERQRQ
jgi:hypothetical protein